MSSRVKDQRLEVEKYESLHRNGSNINQDQIRQAQDIFGDDNEQYHANRLAEARFNTNMEDAFPDEIDDPFSSKAD